MATRLSYGGLVGSISDDGVIRLGGLVGRLVGTLVDGTIYMGGLVGSIQGGVIRFGGLVGSIQDGVIRFGGLVGTIGDTPTPPPSGDPYFDEVVALLHFDGVNGATTFTDVKGHTVTRVGNSVLQTAGALYGTASLNAPDIASGIVIDHDDMALGAGAWTIEGSILLDEIPPLDGDGYGTIFGLGASEADDAGLILYAIPNSDEDPQFGALSMELPGNQGMDSDDGVIEVSTRMHIAVTKNVSNLITLWVGGVLVVSEVDATAPTSVDPKFFLGPMGTYVGCLGRWDEWRVTPGVCRYTGPFTPDPPYPDF